VKANQGAAYLAGHPPWVKGAGHHTLQQDIGALQITVEQPQRVKVLHPLRDVRQAEQAGHLHSNHMSINPCAFRTFSSSIGAHRRENLCCAVFACLQGCLGSLREAYQILLEAGAHSMVVQ